MAEVPSCSYASTAALAANFPNVGRVDYVAAGGEDLHAADGQEFLYAANAHFTKLHGQQVRRKPTRCLPQAYRWRATMLASARLAGRSAHRPQTRRRGYAA